MANYKLTKEADGDLDHILTYGIIHYGEAHADRYYDGLINQFENLSFNPRLYAERHEITPPVRVCPYGVHIIIYTIKDDGTLFVIRVRHGREDWLWERRVT